MFKLTFHSRDSVVLEAGEETMVFQGLKETQDNQAQQAHKEKEASRY
jgi:hypothetical protein